MTWVAYTGQKWRMQVNGDPLNPDNPFREVVTSIARALEVRDAERVSQQLYHYREVIDAVETLLSPPGPRLPLRLRGAAHSMHYMIELLPSIQALLATLPRGKKLRVLDVGPGVVHGSQLLAALYRFPELGYQLDVTAIDIVPTYHYYALAACRDVRHIVGDLNDLRETFDVVIASHVLEHVESPVALCEQMQAKASMAVFVTAPYAEPPDALTEGHRHSLDDDFLTAIEADEHEIYQSPAWGAMKEPPYEVFRATLPGRAPATALPAGPRQSTAATPIPRRLVEALKERPWALPKEGEGEQLAEQNRSNEERNEGGGRPTPRDAAGPARGQSRVRRGLTALSTKLRPPRGQALMDLAASGKVLLTGSGTPVSARPRSLVSGKGRRQ